MACNLFLTAREGSREPARDFAQTSSQACPSAPFCGTSNQASLPPRSCTNLPTTVSLTSITLLSVQLVQTVHQTHHPLPVKMPKAKPTARPSLQDRLHAGLRKACVRAQMEGKDITHLLQGVAGELECDPSELAAMKKSATDETLAINKKKTKTKLHHTPGNHHLYTVSKRGIVLLLTWARNNDSPTGFLYKITGKFSPTGLGVLQLNRDILGVSPDAADSASETLCGINTQNILSLSTDAVSVDPTAEFKTPPPSLRRLAHQLYWVRFAKLVKPPTVVLSSGSLETQALFAIKGLKVTFAHEMEEVLAHDLGKEQLRHELNAESFYARSSYGFDPGSRWAIIRLPGSKFSFLHR